MWKRNCCGRNRYGKEVIYAKFIYTRRINTTNANPNGPEAEKDRIIAEQIMKAMENGKPGINFIGI